MKNSQDPETTLLKAEAVQTAEDTEQINVPGFHLENRKTTLLPQLWIQVHSIPFCSYCTIYNPLLKVCCPLYRGLPVPFRGNIWMKKLSPTRLLYPSFRDLTQVLQTAFSLQPETCPCGGLWGDRKRSCSETLHQNTMKIRSYDSPETPIKVSGESINP